MSTNLDDLVQSSSDKITESLWNDFSRFMTSFYLIEWAKRQNKPLESAEALIDAWVLRVQTQNAKEFEAFDNDDDIMGALLGTLIDIEALKKNFNEEIANIREVLINLVKAGLKSDDVEK